MRSLLISLAVVAALLAVSTNGLAADYELVGFTTNNLPADSTIRGFTEACQADFSADTRMCNSVEVLETVNWPSLPVTSAWVHPVFAPNGSSLTFDLDASGVASSVDLMGSLSCVGWGTLNSGARGLVVNTLAGGNTPTFGFKGCNLNSRVACCGPMPAPALATVPAMLWFGRGLLAALILSAAAGAVFFRGRPVLGSGDRRVSKQS